MNQIVKNPPLGGSGGLDKQHNKNGLNTAPISIAPASRSQFCLTTSALRSGQSGCSSIALPHTIRRAPVTPCAASHWYGLDLAARDLIQADAERLSALRQAVEGDQ
jgi:hypothetical protein